MTKATPTKTIVRKRRPESLPDGDVESAIQEAGQEPSAPDMRLSRDTGTGTPQLAVGSNGKSELFRKEGLVRFLVGLIMTVAGIVTAYHATIYGLKSDIAAKADTAVVTTIDNRLIHIEAILTERVATKTELQQVRDDLHRQLLTIEAKLQLIP